jgi:hypothetical protein
VWLVVSAIASLYYVVCFAAPQLTQNCEAQEIVYGSPGDLSPEERRRRLQEYLDAGRRSCLQQERRRGIQGLLVWGSMVIVSAILLRRERKRTAPPFCTIAPDSQE